MVTEHIKTNEALFLHLYKTSFPIVAGFVHKMGGDFDDAKDIFQDALVIYYEKKNELAEHKAPQYIMGIAKHLWFKKFNDQTQYRSFDDLLNFHAVEKTPEVSENILRFIAVSGKKCLELLTSFYYDKLNMKELAEKFGFSGERSATAQKFKCLEKVRNTIKQRSLTKEDFYE